MVNTALIGQYIQFLRKQKLFSQKELAEKLGVSFQAVSKWETGENLPDAGILLDLADILETSTDKILSAGNLILRKTKKISVNNIKEGLVALENLKYLFGARSLFYLGVIEGINRKMNIDIEAYLQNEKSKEYLLAEAVIQYLLNGYYITEEDLNEHFSSPELKAKIKKYIADTSLFEGKARKYTNFRPPFPREAADLIFSICKHPVIADIGSGTGRLDALLIEKANKLYAIEPNEEMRRCAENELSKFSNYHSLAATAENTTPEEQSIDAIVISSAYHYFDNETAKKEFRRILKPNGFIFLFWDIYENNTFESEKATIDAKYRKKKKLPLSGISPEQRAEHLFGKNTFKKISFETPLLQSFESFFGGWSSASFAPSADSEAYTEFQKEANALFQKYSQNGILETNITTVCFYGHL